MCFVFIWEQTANFAPYITNWLVFITEMKSVYSAVRTGCLNKAVCCCFKGLNYESGTRTLGHIRQREENLNGGHTDLTPDVSSTPVLRICARCCRFYQHYTWIQYQENTSDSSVLTGIFVSPDMTNLSCSWVYGEPNSFVAWHLLIFCIVFNKLCRRDVVWTVYQLAMYM
jgi:hypothetical protein